MSLKYHLQFFDNKDRIISEKSALIICKIEGLPEDLALAFLHFHRGALCFYDSGYLIWIEEENNEKS